MAPSFDIGNPQRSLVRIPGSGVNKLMKPVCLDVAQISSLSRNLSEIIPYNLDYSSDRPLHPPHPSSVLPVIQSALATPRRLTPFDEVNAGSSGSKRKRSNVSELGSISKRFAVASKSAAARSQGGRYEKLLQLYKLRLLELEKVKLMEANKKLRKRVHVCNEILKARKHMLHTLQQRSGKRNVV